jgi:serine/threonine protein kinase/tetratricopeptide (TPR) repeat protein
LTEAAHTERSGLQNAARASRVRAVVDQYLTSCAGDRPHRIPELVAQHPDLMPELGEELRAADLIRQAVSSDEIETRLPGSRDSELIGRAEALEIPGYEIDAEIHRGGQGIVLLATQQSTQRRVAIKVLRRGRFATASERTRFEQEARVLGALRHPNVVAIHDSGVIGQNYYLVMDYIPGESLDAHLRNAPLSVRATLDLFLCICDAVNAAHRTGVIHRDLKPSNIRIDAEGKPHLLDFGLAKFTEVTDEEVTQTGQFVGSLPWASPEQLGKGGPFGRGGQSGESGLRLDLRTDVYSLGVVLYQMLTSAFPYEVKGNLRDVIDNVMHQEPLRPSDLNRSIDDEVDTIVLKCLAKEPDRRYETAGEVARDIRRYLAGEPIEAKRDSGVYQLKKMLWRYRYPTSLIVAATLLLGLSTASLAWMYSQQSRERERAETALVREERQRMLAEARARETQLVASFQEEMLRQIDPAILGQHIQDRYREAVLAGLKREWLGQWPNRRQRSEAEIAAGLEQFDQLAAYAYPADVARQVVSAHLLGPAAVAARVQFNESPQVLGRLQFAFGNAFQGLGLLPEAEREYRAALDHQIEVNGNGSHQAAATRKALGALLTMLGHYEAAEQILREALIDIDAFTQPDPVARADVRNYLAVLQRLRGNFDEAEALHRQALETLRATTGTQSIKVAATLSDLGDLRQVQGEYEAAENLYREALELRREQMSADDPVIAANLNNLAAIRWDQGDPVMAERLLREALGIYRSRLGDDHPEIATTLMNLAVMRQAQQDYAEAETLQRQALKATRRLLGDEHPDVATCLNNLGELLVSRGAYAEGEPLLLEALARRRAIFGDDGEPISAVLNNLATAALGRGDLALAETRLQEALAIDRKVHGETHPHVIYGLNNLGALLQQTGQIDKAIETLQEAIRLAEKTKQDNLVLVSQTNLGFLYLETGEPAAAAPLLKAAYVSVQRMDSAPSSRSVLLQTGIALCLISEGEFQEAERLLKSAQQAIETGAVPGGIVQRVRDYFVILYEAWDAAEPDAGYAKRADAWRDERSSSP